MKTFQIFERRMRIEPTRAFLSNLHVPRRTVHLLIGAALVGLMVLALGGVSPVSAAATILVDDNADGDLDSLKGDGKCQLREAIEAANTNVSVDACNHDEGGSPGLDTINFNLQGVAPSGNSVILLVSPLIVTEPVVIDGTSDPDWTIGSAPTIEINGSDDGFDGFILDTGSDGSSIKGFQLMDFTGTVTATTAVWVKSSNNYVQSNYIGTDGSNSTSKGNDIGVYVTGSGNTIGGSGPGEGNLIAVNSIAGVYLVGADATDNVVQGNMMGTFPDGTTGGLGNKVAVLIDGASSNLIGGTATIGLCGQANPAGSVCNVITSSNDSDPGSPGAGVRIIQTETDVPTGNLIQGNFIGLGANGTSTWANYYGVHILAGSGNWVGGLLSGQGNTISGNTLYGIYLDDPSATALLTTTIARNKIGLAGDGLSGRGNLGSGIYVNGTKDTTIGNTVGYVGGNLIGDNGSVATDAGITAVDAVNLQILGNRFGLDVESNPLPSTNAIYIAEGMATSPTVKIYGNRISNHAVGILDDDPEAALISDSKTNCITGNTMGYNNTSGTPRPFSDNWWGDPTGPFPTGLGDAVSDNVNFTPFLTTAPTTCDPFAPTLKKPKNGSGIYFPKAVKFGWSVPRNIVANNFLQIDNDPAFTSLEIDDGSGQGWDVTLMTRGYAWLGAPMGKYYWRIKALSPEGFVGYSPVRTFYVTLLTRPKNNAIITDTTPIFKWKSFPLALSYDLNVGTSPTCGASPVISVIDWVGTSYKVELNPLTPGTYYWCVQPDNGPDTPVYTFTIPAPAP